MAEHRQHIRLGKSLVVTYLLSTEILKGKGKSRNISEGGLCLPLLRRLEAGTLLDLEIKVADDQKPLLARGEVAWVQGRQDSRLPFEAGIKFIKIDPVTKRELRQIIDKFIAVEGPGQVSWLEGSNQ